MYNLACLFHISFTDSRFVRKYKGVHDSDDILQGRVLRELKHFFLVDSQNFGPVSPHFDCKLGEV